MENSDPPSDFDSFLAERRGISRAEARELLEQWLTTYTPLIQRRIEVVSNGCPAAESKLDPRCAAEVPSGDARLTAAW